MHSRIWFVWESNRVGVTAFPNLACRRVMGAILLHQGGVLGLITLGFHRVMSTLWIACVMTGSLVSGWYCTWSVSVIQVFTIVVCEKSGHCKVVIKLRVLVALDFHWVMRTLRMQGVITGELISGWYCDWSVSGIVVVIIVLVHELG